jgi:hypothetical protein
MTQDSPALVAVASIVVQLKPRSHRRTPSVPVQHVERTSVQLQSFRVMTAQCRLPSHRRLNITTAPPELMHPISADRAAMVQALAATGSQPD